MCCCTPKALYNQVGGSLLNHHQCAASTWMMRRLPQDNGASALTTHQLLGVGWLSAPILSILPIIDIGHFQNRFADNFFFFIMQTNILFTGDIIYWWLNNTGEIIKFLNALFGSMQPVWAQHSVRVRRSLNLWEQSPPTAHLICRESRVRPINAENWRQSHTESTC